MSYHVSPGTHLIPFCCTEYLGGDMRAVNTADGGLDAYLQVPADGMYLVACSVPYVSSDTTQTPPFLIQGTVAITDGDGGSIGTIDTPYGSWPYGTIVSASVIPLQALWQVRVYLRVTDPAGVDVEQIAHLDIVPMSATYVPRADCPIIDSSLPT